MVTSEKKLFYYLLITLTACFMVILIVRYVMIMFPHKEAAYHESLAISRVQRGTIYDRNGTILAYEAPYYSCAVLLKDVGSLDDTIIHLSRILDSTVSEIQEALAGKSTYAMIKKHLSDAEYTTLREAVRSGDLPGVTIEKRYGRIYPQGSHGAHVIGFTDIDNVGLTGIEYSFDTLLSPLHDPSKEITQGNDIYLTIDHRIQFDVDNRCRELTEEHHPDSAVILVMDAKTGELLAYTSYPRFDLNDYNLSTAEERLNRPISMMYEPGSVFKIFSLASILDIGDANTDKLFLCDGSYTFTMDNGKSATINCLKPHGEVGPKEILKYSCNGGISYYALQTDSNKFYKHICDFGFNQKTAIDLPGEISGMLQTPANWSGRSKPTISFGQEIGVTALQMTTAATVFTHDGYLLKPRIVRAIYDPGTKKLTYTEPSTVRKVISKKTAHDILTMMVSVTEPGGTAIHAKHTGVTVSAKTGTAQILDLDTNTYSADHVLASSIAILPTEDPQYIIYVAADNPTGGEYYGSAVAAPTIEKITEDLISLGLLDSSSSDIRYVSTE